VGSWSPPKVSRSQVSKAGRRIGAGAGTLDDIVALENWRASHAYVINTFQANLRNRSRGTDIVVGTRLKRRATIVNKLKRFPDMQLGRMHDIAGCRIIFPDLDSLVAFRKEFHSARFQHKRRGIDDDNWNYIERPKPDGYRGIHDVYEYDVRSDGGIAWNGLTIEIQYRTLIQHAWATAVEVAGLLTANNPKLGQGNPDFIEFFALASEILARSYENSTSCYPNIGLEEVVSRFRELENNIRIVEMFRRVNSKVVDIDFKQNNILIFPFVNSDKENESRLTITGYRNVTRAIEEYNKIERDFQDKADVVLVRADSFENLKVTFRNYFADTTDFVDLLDKAIV
jgi:putative GTP pyrophosphokinase